MQQGVVIRDGKPVARDAFTPPDLAEMVAKYQAFLAPEDPRFGEGIAGWDITSEYDNDPQSENGTGPIWGCMCSPSVLASEGRRVKLQPEDVAAKQAHIVVRTPTSRNELIEIERTVLHELGHVLHAKLNLPRDAEEEIMHSLDHFFSKLSPEQGQILARSFQNPMARAYRAENTAMPDPIEEKKEPDKEAPKMAEGGPRDVATIQGEIAKAALAGQPVDELAKELALALVAAGSAAGSSAAPVAPIEPPTMGMKPEEAYARGKKEAEAAAEAKAVKAYANTLQGFSAEQLAMVRECSTVESAERLVKVCVKPNGSGQTMGALPGKIPGKTTNEKPMARAIRTASENPMLRKILGIGSLDNDGVHFEPGNGILVYTDGTEQLNHQRAVYNARQDKLRGAA
jgi:hypothetical protein